MQISEDALHTGDVLRAENPDLDDLQQRFDDRGNPELGPVIERWQAAASDIEELLADERKLLEDASERLAAMHDRIEGRIEQNAALANSVHGLTKSKGEAGSDLLRRLEVSTREIAMLSRLLRERERVAEIAEDSARWLASVHRAHASCPAWWRFMPLRWQKRKKSERLRRQGVFDGQAYLKRYPDVARARMDALQHYIFSGMSEGRLR